MTSLERELESSTQSLSTANSDLARHRSKVTQLQALVDVASKKLHTPVPYVYASLLAHVTFSVSKLQ